MKRYISVVLVLLMLICIASCNLGKQKEPPREDSSTEISSAEVSFGSEEQNEILPVDSARVTKAETVRQQIQQNLNDVYSKLYAAEKNDKIISGEHQSVEFAKGSKALSALCDELYLFYKEAILAKLSRNEKELKDSGLYSEAYVSEVMEYKEHFVSYCKLLEKVRDDSADVVVDLYQMAYFGSSIVPELVLDNEFVVSYSNMEQMGRLYQGMCQSYDTNEDGKYCYEEFLERFEKYADKEEIEKYLNEA